MIKNNSDMNTLTQDGYISPEVKFVEIIVEKGFSISGIVINHRYGQGVEEHIVDEVESW